MPDPDLFQPQKNPKRAAVAKLWDVPNLVDSNDFNHTPGRVDFGRRWCEKTVGSHGCVWKCNFKSVRDNSDFPEWMDWGTLFFNKHIVVGGFNHLEKY